MRNSGPIRAVIVDGEALFRECLRVTLSHTGRIDVVGDFPDGESALEAVPKLNPDSVILDVVLPGGLDGVQLGRRLRQILPCLGIVLLSHHRERTFWTAVPEAERAGWSYLLKQSVSDVDSLVRAVEGSAAGYVILDPDLVKNVPQESEGVLQNLPLRQQEILELVARGLSNTAIAKALVLSRKTVENQLNAIYAKIGIDRSDATVHPRVTAVLTYLRQMRAVDLAEPETNWSRDHDRSQPSAEARRSG